MRVPAVSSLWPLGAQLGEGLAWSEAEQALCFVDIKAVRVHRFAPATGEGSTMDIGEEKEMGTFWCLDRGRLIPAGAIAVVTNGPACCVIHGVIYHVDSTRRRIWRCRLGPDSSLAESTLFVQLGEDEGYPDGVVVEAEGCLWVALWDGWGVRRYTPEGEMLLHVRCPARASPRSRLAAPG